jgi:uncharacterized protein (DUF2147 family)
MKKLLFLGLFLFISNMYAQSVTGKWYSVDDDNEKKSIIEVYKQGDKLYAKILKLVKPEDDGNLCEECEGENHNKPIEGMVILKGLTEDGDEWNGGKILDPESGNIYKCYIELEKADKLKVRGYMGFSLLGRTEYWYRVK